MRPTRPRRGVPVALTIAGSDSGGGAGIQADLKTFAALGVHGTSAITCLTAQNPDAVRAIQAARPVLVRRQVEAVFEAWTPDAMKTGMLFSAEIIRAVVRVLRQLPRVPLVVDPVMVATSGARLLQPDAIRVLMDGLLPLASLVTPNVDEAAILTGLTLRRPEDLRRAARALVRRFGCAALVKGGHLAGAEAIDIFDDGRTHVQLTAARVRGVSTHGTGCTYSAAITAYRARGHSLRAAVRRAKPFLTRAIAHGLQVGRHRVLNPFR
ncbi:MAG: bifunctional hydroxymethylpyrimidine kinase/phosphomethylpyrimidine kinase [Verrucomicrobia bacterium]|nr:bifunctional hydroxymethylpyrimidine kinase/phosphomethylpyrimidine kinase [Verrucomicrobiota bacterium]